MVHTVSLPDRLAPLAAQRRVKEGAAPYFLALRNDPDIYVSVGAWCALLDARQLANREDLWDELIGMCRYAAVKRRAFEFFERQVYEHAIAKRVADAEVISPTDAITAGMRATIAFDAVAGEASNAALYLATGDLNCLDRAMGMADIQGGWKVSLPWAIRMIVISPMSSSFHQRTLSMLSDATQVDLLEACGSLLQSIGLFGEIGTLFLAAAALDRGDPASCLARVTALLAQPATSSSPLGPYRGTMLALKAQAEEKLGKYRDAFASYLATKASQPKPAVDPEEFFRRTVQQRALHVPALPPDTRHDVVQMLGFARSGTTLLENILDSHPKVETFEEIAGLKAAMDTVAAYISGRRPSPADPAGMYLAARAKYYEELDIRREKPDASVLVDKLPMRTSEADFMHRLFPEWRYVFALRHPFDVALSCLKQRFGSNPAMDNFRTFEGTVRSYDHTMSEWFGIHTLDDPAVHYIRYDELVTDFERVASGILRFLGLEWDDEVRNFAGHAERRQAFTPSYQKVRQGLSIGVQTYWRNYGFVFQSEAANPLHKWAEFFGFETQ